MKKLFFFRIPCIAALITLMLTGLSVSQSASAKNVTVQFPTIVAGKDLSTVKNALLYVNATATMGLRNISVPESILDEKCIGCFLVLREWYYYDTSNRWHPTNGWSQLYANNSGLSFRDALKQMNAQLVGNEYGGTPVQHTPEGYPSWIKSCFALYFHAPGGVTNPDGFYKLVKDSWTEFDPDTGTGDCFAIPPNPQLVSCTFQNSALSFDFGILNRSSAVGTSLSKSVVVSCTQDADFTISTIDKNDATTLSNGMLARFKINSVSPGKTIKGVTGNNTVTLTTTLEGSPASAGAFSGSSVMVLDFP